MAAPSLSEFTNIKPEASTNPGVILDSRDAISQLNQSAQFNAEMKQKRYAQQLDAIKGVYQDLGAIQETPVMQQDRPILNKMMGEVLTTLAEDPHAALGGPKFAEIQKKLGQLRTMATASKQDNIYNDAHNKILENDPELGTPDNKQKVAQFNAAPLGQRQKFLLDTPVKFDAEAAMGKILQQKQVAVPYARTSFEGPHNEWMIRETGTTYQRDPALKIWNQGYNTGTDANNQPIKRWAAEQFTKIQDDPDQLAKLGNPKSPEEFYQNLGKIMYGPDQDIIGEKSSTRTPNPYTMLDKRNLNSLYMEAMREGNREKLSAVRADLRLKGAPENANFLVRQYANIVGNTTGQSKTVEVSKGKFEKEDKVDVPSNILKNYATTRKETLKEGHSYDPITETIVQGNQPDLVTRTADGNLRLTFYKHYDKSDKIPKGKHVGDLVTDANGNEMIGTTGVIPKRNLLTTLGKGVVETKILSSAIDVADQALKGINNSVIDKINAGEDEGTAIQQTHQEKKPATAKKSYSFNGKNYGIEQIEKAAKASGLSVDEYIKKAGLK